MASSSFFSGASNVTIVGGDFNDVKGNLTVFDHSRHTSNVNSSNTYNTKVLHSHNDNSTTISGWGPRAEDDQMPSRPSKSADHREESHTAPPPPPPQFDPQQISSAGGTVTNLDSYNVKNTNIDHAFNNNSHNYYRGGAPPPNQKGQHNGPPWMSGPDQEANPPGSRLTGPRSGQFTVPLVQPPFQTALPQQTVVGGPSGPHMSVNSGLIQPMDQHMQRNFEKLLKFTLSQTQSLVAGNGGANYNPAAAFSSSSNPEGDDSVNTGMANLSLNDPLSSSMASTHTQISSHLSSPTTFSRTKSDPQIGLKPTPPDQIDTSNPSTSNLSPYSNAVQYGSHSNPSLAPHMNEPGMVNFLSLPVQTQHGNNSNGPPPVSTSPFNFPPSSSGGPNFNTYYGNLTKHDHRVHQTNIDSFNQHNHTTQDSFNDNSYTSTGKHSAPENDKKRGSAEPDLPRKKRSSGEKTLPDPQILVEETSSDEADEHIPTAAQSGVNSPGKKKSARKWPSFRRK